MSFENSRKRVGAHVSAEGGVQNAPARASEIGARAFALFVKNQRQWTAKPITDEQAAAFREACAGHGYTPADVLPHDGYLINLGNPDPEGLKKSRDAFLDEMRRCEVLGLTALNFHPGSHRNLMDEDACLDLVAESINLTLEATSGVTAVIENTAGQGGYLGRTFEQIARLIDLVEDKSRAGVCLDTCHMHAAGYDLLTREGYEATLAEFDAVVGLRYLRGMHLNDAKGERGGRLDRHESLGEGRLGLEVFRWIMNDPRLDGIPMVLETPNPDAWAREVALLYSLEKDAG